jgi:hypothetical protein
MSHDRGLLPGGDNKLPSTTIAELARQSEITVPRLRKNTGIRNSGRLNIQGSIPSGELMSVTNASAAHKTMALIRRVR